MKAISYIGSKEKLFSFLDEFAFSKFDKTKKMNFVDGFTGTTLVAKKIFKETNWDVEMFDISNYSDILSSSINPDIDNEKVVGLIKELDLLEPVSGIIFNELSMYGNVTTIEDQVKAFDNQEIKSRMFFSKKIGQKIDAIRNHIFKLKNEKKINLDEEKLLLLFLVRFADKNANTTSVYGAYLKNDKEQNYPFYKDEDFDFIRSLSYDANRNSVFKQGDIIQNIKNISSDKDKTVIYLDPPYNTRRYETNYHILNYLIDEDFSRSSMKPNSKTATPVLTVVNRFASKVKTEGIFIEMIEEAKKKSEFLYISYNNEGIVTEDRMKEICDNLGYELNTYKKDYKKFTSGEKRHEHTVKKQTVEEILWEII